MADVVELQEEGKEFNSVRDAGSVSAEGIGEIRVKADLPLMVFFEPETKELPLEFREWMHEKGLFIRQVQIHEDGQTGMEYLMVMLSNNPRPDGFNEYWAG